MRQLVVVKVVSFRIPVTVEPYRRAVTADINRPTKCVEHIGRYKLYVVLLCNNFR